MWNTTKIYSIDVSIFFSTVQWKKRAKLNKQTSKQIKNTQEQKQQPIPEYLSAHRDTLFFTEQKM